MLPASSVRTTSLPIQHLLEGAGGWFLPVRRLSAGCFLAKGGRTITLSAHAEDVPEAGSATEAIDVSLVLIADADQRQARMIASPVSRLRSRMWVSRWRVG